MKLRDLVLSFVSYFNDNFSETLYKLHNSLTNLFNIRVIRDDDITTVSMFFTKSSDSISVDYNLEDKYIEITINPFIMGYYFKIDLDDFLNDFDETTFILKCGRKLSDEYLLSNIEIIYESIDEIIGLIGLIEGC